jgi:hypothetical protein
MNKRVISLILLAMMFVVMGLFLTGCANVTNMDQVETQVNNTTTGAAKSFWRIAGTIMVYVGITVAAGGVIYGFTDPEHKLAKGGSVAFVGVLVMVIGFAAKAVR